MWEDVISKPFTFGAAYFFLFMFLVMTFWGVAQIPRSHVRVENQIVPSEITSKSKLLDIQDILKGATPCPPPQEGLFCSQISDGKTWMLTLVGAP